MNHLSSYYFLQRITSHAARILSALLITLFLQNLHAEPVLISAEPYPVGDLRVTREDLSPSEFRLDVKNLNLSSIGESRSRTVSWYVAGAKGVAPQVDIERATYVLLDDNKVTSMTQSPSEQLKSGLVKVTEIGLFRQYWVYSVTITSVTPSGRNRQWVLDGATVKFNLGTPPGGLDPAVSDRWKPSMGEQGLLGGMLINPEVDSSYYTMDYTDPVDTWDAWGKLMADWRKAGDLIRFSIYRGGIYRISKDEITSHTGKQVATPVSQWRVYHNGAEVPLIPGDNPDDIAYLPVGAYDGNDLTEQVYWIRTDSPTGNATTAAKRLVTHNPTDLPEPDSSSSFTTASFRIVHRELTDYNPRVKPGIGTDRWIWRDITPQFPESFNLKMPSIFDNESSETVELSIQFTFSNYPQVQPSVVLFADNKDAGSAALPTATGIATITVPANTLKPGDNEIALRLVYPETNSLKRPVSIQHITTQWSQVISKPPAGESLSFKPPVTFSPDTLSVQVPSENAEQFLLVSYSDREASLHDAASGSITWKDKPVTEIHMVDKSAALSPARITAVELSRELADLPSAQSIIITDPELTTGALELREIQRNRGLTAEVYTTDEIYNLLSYGRPDPTALRNFSRFLFHRAKGDVPEYITLIGEASDFRGDHRVAPSTTQRDMIPAGSANNAESMQGDQLYAAAIGPDSVADFAVGRIPAASISELEDYLEKIRKYENQTDVSWSRITEFVMDDNDEFPEVVGRINTVAVAPTVQSNLFRQWDFEYVPNLRVPGKKRSWDATDLLVEKFNEGVGIINYFGHGGPNLWSHERLLHLSDLKRIQNGERLPFITCASCDNAWITYPLPPVNKSMGEIFVLKPDGGALGLFGPVAGASPYEHSTLVQNLMEAFVRNQVRRIGDATFFAENMYFAATRSTSIPDQYLLLGDPTAELLLPRVGVLDLGDGLDRVLPGDTMRISLPADDSGHTSGVLSIFDGAGHQMLDTHVFKGNLPMAIIPVPKGFDGGALHLLWEGGDSTSMTLAGATVRVLPNRATGGNKGEKVRQTGDKYVVEIEDSFTDRSSSSSDQYQFRIQSSETSETMVQIKAFNSAGHMVAEVPRLGLTSATLWSSFSINPNVPMEGDDAQLTLEIFTLDGDNPPAYPLMSVTFKVPVQAKADLQFKPGSARVYSASGELKAGRTVFLEAELENIGRADAVNFVVQAFRDASTTGTELQTINESTGQRIEHLAAGESRKVLYRWENPTVGTHSQIMLVANNNGSVSEYKRDNNTIILPDFEIGLQGNFLVDSFSVHPPFGISGTTVTASAVLSNERIDRNQPITVELGWGRSFDSETSSTRFPVEFVDGYSTITQDILVPENFTYAYIKVNADLEVEESNGGDNTAKTPEIVVQSIVPTVDNQIDMAPTIIGGSGYNFDFYMDRILKTSPVFTSQTSYLLVDQSNVLSGKASRIDDPSDGAWWVQNWRIAIGENENPGPISFSLPLDSIGMDVPGKIYGFFHPQPDGSPTTEISLPGNAPGVVIAEVPVADRLMADFGVTRSHGGHLLWTMQQVDGKPFVLEYMRFHLHAVQWDSPPYLLPEDWDGQPLEFTVETNDPAQWESIHLSWRGGTEITDETGTQIQWGEWNSRSGTSISMNASRYVQVRIMGIPKDENKPYIENIRLIKK